MAWCIKPKIRVFFPGLLRFLSKTCWRYISCRKVSLLLNIMEAHCSCLVAHKVLKHYIWKIQLQYFYKKCYLDKKTKKKTAHKPWCRQFHGGTKLHQPHMSLCRRKHQAPSHQSRYGENSSNDKLLTASFVVFPGFFEQLHHDVWKGTKLLSFYFYFWKAQGNGHLFPLYSRADKYFYSWCL